MQSLPKAFCAALVIPCTLALTALDIYFANMSELPGNPGAVCTMMFIWTSIGVVLLCLVQLPFLGSSLGRNVFPWIATTLFTLGFLFWFQANVFNWDFGPMNGREIPWKEYRLLGIFELFVYGAIVLTALCFRKKLFENMVPISCMLIFIQAIPVSVAAVKTLTQETALQTEQTEEPPEHSIFVSSWKQYSMTFDGFFEFSPEENVVLIVLDALGKTIFDEIQKEHPEEIEEIFRDFTCFTNAMSDRPGTKWNIPQILTGCSSGELPPDEPMKRGEPMNGALLHKLFNRDEALLKTLHKNQYRCDVLSWFPSVMDHDSRWIANICFHNQHKYIADTTEMIVLSLYRSVPTLWKRRVLKSLAIRDLFRFNVVSHSSYRPLKPAPADYEVNTIVCVTPRTSFADRKTFKFIHLQGAHPVPVADCYIMDENCMPTKSYGTKARSAQALGSLRITRNIFELMKESGVYDQSLIIVMADHDSAGDTEKEWNDPIFLLKRKQSKQSQMSYNDNPVHIADTTPTILSELGILQGEAAFSPFEMPESLVEERNRQWRIWRDE